jgi:TonB family protein
MKMNLETVLESRRREDKFPSKFIFFSFMLHFGLIAAIFVGSRLLEPQKIYSPFISASLIPARGLPGFSPVSTGQKNPEKTEVKEPPREEKSEDAVKLPSLDEMKKDKGKDKGTGKDKGKDEASAKIPKTGSGDKTWERYGLPDGSENGYGAQSGSISSMTVDDFEYTWYSASVAGILSKNWVRSLAPPDLRGTSVIARFRIYEDGKIDDIILVKRCNVFALDQEVIRAISNSSPLPPLPKGFQKQSLVAQYEFVY